MPAMPELCQRAAQASEAAEVPTALNKAKPKERGCKNSVPWIQPPRKAVREQSCFGKRSTAGQQLHLLGKVETWQDGALLGNGGEALWRAQGWKSEGRQRKGMSRCYSACSKCPAVIISPLKPACHPKKTLHNADEQQPQIPGTNVNRSLGKLQIFPERDKGLFC